MTASVLVDTNILVYAYDRSEYDKQQRAVTVLDELASNGLGILSTQVLAEFFVTVTRKIVVPLSVAEARIRIDHYLHAWTIINVTGMVIMEATRGVQDYQLSFWDAQIWATARLHQIPVVFSEDFNVGASLEGVRFINPLVSDFRLANWMS
ncbi:MAG: PIN domain-containing protein [Herpetosiphonaceae bacterium]|nr:PIN domain-containing protein [Herpetosiphonaceae bacterium]